MTNYKKYYQTSSGVLKTAKTLKAEKNFEEAISNIKSHFHKKPKFIKYKYTLAWKLYEKGLIFEAWQQISTIPPMDKDSLFLILCIKILTNDTKEINNYIQKNSAQISESDQTKKIYNILKTKGIHEAQNKIKAYFHENKIEIIDNKKLDNKKSLEKNCKIISLEQIFSQQP